VQLGECELREDFFLFELGVAWLTTLGEVKVN